MPISVDHPSCVPSLHCRGVELARSTYEVARPPYLPLAGLGSPFRQSMPRGVPVAPLPVGPLAVFSHFCIVLLAVPIHEILQYHCDGLTGELLDVEL